MFNYKKIYMIGVKGVGMTMLAQFFADSGVSVVGSDVEEKFMTDEGLARAGVKVLEGFDKKNIPLDADLIVYSTAYNAKNNVEVAAILTPGSAAFAPRASGRGELTEVTAPLWKGGKKVLTYAEALGEVFNQRHGIAVVGSHGKTTTTAWLGYVLEKSGFSPSVMVGARVPQFDGSALLGKSNYLIVEADEYQNKLANFNPKGVLLNNIDYDHPDFFKTIDDYNKVFIEFIKKIPKSGFLIANFDDPIIRSVARVNCRGKVVSYGINEAADLVAYDIKKENPLRLVPSTRDGQASFNKEGIYGRQYFKVKFGADGLNPPDPLPHQSAGQVYQGGDNELGDFSIQLSGRHNISNALAVIATCIELGVELVDIRKYLSDFTGTARRMQVLGAFRGATIIDDYAHHPTEISSTLAGVREVYGTRQIKVVFHPHTFTRTKALLDDFAKSFKDADEVIVLDIYGSAREEQGGVHSRDLVKKIKINQPPLAKGGRGDFKVVYIATMEECEEYLRKNIERNDVVILMGAGDVFRIGENLIK